MEEPDRAAATREQDCTLCSCEHGTTSVRDRDRHKISRIPWAELLLRVFREDVLLCPCGGRRVVLAFITEKKVVKEILEHLGLPSTGPPVAPTRITAASEEAPGRMTCRSCSKRCADGQPYAYVLISPCAAEFSLLPPRSC